MLKKSTLLLATLLVGQFAVAQQAIQEYVVDSVVTTEVKNADKYRVETNRFGSNWFVGAGVGVQTLFSDHAKMMGVVDRFTPSFDAYVGKWFTPGIGVRFGLSGLNLKGVSGKPGYEGFIVEPRVPVYREKAGYDLYRTSIDFLHIYADVMFNTSQMVGGYKPNRFYSFIPYLGVGWAQSLNKASTTGNPSQEPTVSIGMIHRLRLSEALDLNFDVRGAYVGDRFDQQIGGRWGEGLLSANIGVSYNFNKRGWDRSKVVTTRVNEGLLQGLRERVGQLQAMNDDLRRQLEQSLTRVVTPQNVCEMPLLVTFQRNRWALRNADRVNLGFLAEHIKANPGMTYTVVGYADEGTGSVKRNTFLARKRAEVIQKCLVEEFGVSENQLRVDSKGGVANMYYNDPRCSRAVLLQVAK